MASGIVSTVAIIGAGVMLLSSAPARAGDAPATSSQSSCVDVRIGQDRSAYMNCLNQQLQQDVDQQHAAAATATVAPIDAQSPAHQVGAFDENAAREKMGNAFGRSSTPQRPEQNFVVPLTAGH